MFFNPMWRSLRGMLLDPHKNVLGRTVTSRGDVRSRLSNAGNESFTQAVDFPNIQFETFRLISYIRSGCLSASMTRPSSRRNSVSCELNHMEIGRVGQHSRVGLPYCFLLLMTRRTPKWRGDANRRFRHLWHTWASTCHSHSVDSGGLNGEESIRWKENMRRRASSERPWIVAALSTIVVGQRLGDDDDDCDCD